MKTAEIRRGVPARVGVLTGLVAAMVLFVATAGAQSTVPEAIRNNPELVRQYLDQQKDSPEFQQQLKTYRGTGEQSAAGERAKKSGTDPDARKDSLDQKKPPQRSVYEDMIRGVAVHPDSMLENLRVFGHDFFENLQPSSYVQGGDPAAVPAGYPVGAGDEIIVVLWGRMNEEHRLKVDREGNIKIPRLGPISVAGQPFAGVQKDILARVQNIEGVQASVSMGQMRSIPVYIVGEVKAPGLYTISALSNVTNALFAAGGPTRNGSLRGIELKRNGQRIASVDFYDFLLSGENKTGLRLQAGDVILVPVAQKMAAAVGNVRRGALYEITSSTTLKDLLDLAGGMTPAAWTGRIQVERFTQNQHQVVLDLKAESLGEVPKFAIQDGDVVKVFPVVVRDKNAVYLEGNVLRPGKYEFKEGMKLTDLLPGYPALLSETYLDYAVVKRQEPPAFLESILPISLRKALDNPSSDDNIPLQPQDRVVVYHKDFFEPDRTVSISGAVNSPGNQKLLENMTVRDLVLMAGGLREDASPFQGELYRRTLDGELVVTEKTDFCTQCAMENDPQHNLRLQRLDRILIRTKKGWQEQKRIVLKGELVFPGEYVILEGEALGELVRRAGGFTKEAYLAAAVFKRESVKDLERRRIDDYVRQLEMDIVRLSGELISKEKSEEAQALLAQQRLVLEKLRATQPVGRVVIDMTDAGSYDDFLLEDGDSLYVPKDLSTVSIIGEVYNPATFRLDRRRSTVGTYVELAGGFKEQADKKHTYVIKANGSVKTRTSGPGHRLDPGDVVVVPQKIRYVSGYKIFMDTVDAAFKIATVAAVVFTLVSNASGG